MATGHGLACELSPYCNECFLTAPFASHVSDQYKALIMRQDPTMLSDDTGKFFWGDYFLLN